MPKNRSYYFSLASIMTRRLLSVISITFLISQAQSEQRRPPVVVSVAPAFHVLAVTARGGASSSSSSSSEQEELPTEQSSSSSSSSPTKQNEQQGNIISISSLFRLNNEIKAQVSQHQADQEETADNEGGPVSPHNKGRGGALAVVRERPRLFGAFDTSSIVAPLESRLIQEDDDNGDDDDHDHDVEAKLLQVQPQVMGTTTTTTTEDRESDTATRKLWWNNAWQQQFPQEEGEMEAIEVIAETIENEVVEKKNAEKDKTTNVKNVPSKKDDNLDEEEAFDELEVLVKAEKDERNKRTKGSSSSTGKKSESPVQPTNTNLRTGQEEELENFPKPTEAESQTGTIILPSNVTDAAPQKESSPFESSGYWGTIDNLLTIGFASKNPNIRLSRRLRVMRKQMANITGLHGIISGKGRDHGPKLTKPEEFDEHMGIIRRRLAAIERARGNLAFVEQGRAKDGRGRKIFGAKPEAIQSDYEKRFSHVLEKEKERAADEARRKRVQEIDSLIAQGQERLLELITEKDILQRRPNPLWNYTTDLEDLEQARMQLTENLNSTGETKTEPVVPKRQFNFPPPDLVEEYLTMLLSSGRLIKLNHTDLWKNGAFNDDDEDDDEWLSPKDKSDARQNKRNGKGSGGSRWLRNGLGEKLGETVETAAYRAVGGGVMSFLARTISSLHGINVMHHTDIRLFTEQAPLLPPAAGIIPGAMGGSNYAHGAFENALKRGSRKAKKRRKRRDESFIQRDAVVETLLSQCQIAMPLFKIFPLAWQRAMLGNIVTLITSIMMDFCEGLEFQILGHRLSFSFVPITEEDMMRHWASAASDVFKRRHANAPRFEAAVRATANDVAENLNFLDRWHERLLGADALKTQLSHLIARLVLTLVDETLSGARMDLWTTHAGGPRLIAGLEYRPDKVK